MVGDNAGGGSFIHGRDHLGISADGTVFISSDANDTSGTGVSDIIFGYGSAVDLNSSPTSTYADSFPSDKPRVELMRLNSSNGRVGIGITAPNEKLTVGGSILASGSAYMTVGVNQTDSGQVRMGITSGTSRAHIKIESNNSTYPEYLTVQGTNNVMMTVSQSRLDVWDNVGVQGIVLQSLASTNGWGGGQFNGDSDVKVNQIYFTDHAGSSDNGWIRHETSGTTSPDNDNKAQLHIAPSDDISGDDLISFGSSNTSHANSHKFYTSGLTYVGGYLGINQTTPQNMLHVRVDTVSVGTSHDNDIGILIQQDGTGDAGIEFECGTQYWSMFLDNSQDDLLIRDISNSRTLAQFTDSGNVILGHSGHVYGRYQANKATTLYRFHGLYLTWDSDSYGTDYEHSITSTNGTEGTDGSGTDSITINSFDNILINIDSNNNDTNSTFKIGHKTTDTANILFTLDETGLITTTNTIKMADTNNYWLATGASTNWGLYWRTDSTNNTLEWHGGGTEVGYIDLDNGNAVHRGWVYGDYFRATEAPGGASSSEVRLGKGTSNVLKIQATNGYLNIGPQNVGWCHFYTDAPAFYFDKDVTTNGEFTSYDEDLILRRLPTGDDYLQILNGYSRFVVNGTEQFRIDTNSVNLFNNKKALSWNEYSNDNWFRINSSGDFSDGTYFGSGTVRTDGTLQVGSSGASWYANTSAIVHNELTTLKQATYANADIRFGNTTDYRRIYFSSSTGRLNFNRKGVTNSVYIENGDNDGQIKTTFTGQHKNKPSSDLSNFVGKKGHIVVSTGIYANIPENRSKEQIDEDNTEVLTTPQITEALPTVAFSTQINDKKVWGVLADWDDPDTTSSEEKPMYGGLGTRIDNREDDRLVINSLGEGAIMVSNYNGNFENGDYITTSPIEGIGMKQDDDLLHNYTVAKITQDEDFTSGTTTVGSTYKSKLVGCTYHCG